MKQLWEYSVEELAERCAVAESEIERLEQVIAFGVDMRIALAREKDAEIERLSAEKAELVAALRPFVDARTIDAKMRGTASDAIAKVEGEMSDP